MEYGMMIDNSQILEFIMYQSIYSEAYLQGNF